MTKEQLWTRYVERNPHWLTEGAHLTPAGVRALFDQTYEVGRARGRAEAEPAGRSAPSRGIDDLIKDILRKPPAR